MSNPEENELNLKVFGGDGSAEYGVKVFGASNAQHPVEGSNVIAMNVVKGGKGKKSRKNMNKGGNLLSDIAVPVTLLYANQVYSSKKSRENKNKGGSVLSDIAVPVTLLYANHAYSSKKSNKSFKNKKSLKNRTRSYRNYRK